MTITQVGFIGLGNMGWPMAAHLAEAGFTLTVSDVAPGVTERFAAEHPATATAAAGPQSFAAVQALILMLPTSAIVVPGWIFKQSMILLVCSHSSRVT